MEEDCRSEAFAVADVAGMHGLDPLNQELMLSAPAFGMTRH